MVRQRRILRKCACQRGCLRGLTFELSRRRRWDARPGMQKMYSVPVSRAWWPAVGARLQRGVRHRHTETQRNMNNYHSHPSGLRFVRQDASNAAAVKLAAWLNIRNNGWNSWLDIDESSSDHGRWVLFNTATKATYVEKRMPNLLSTAALQS